MKIYTKTGDQGTTGLFGGTRVSKADDRVETYGTVDELNAHIGLVRDQKVNRERQAIFQEIQENLFNIGALLAADPAQDNLKLPRVEASDVQHLEQQMDEMDETLPNMRYFILPGGHPSVSIGHVARCVCRRAERQVVRFSEQNTVDPFIIIYLNRLSDWLFVFTRTMGQELSVEEIPWKPKKGDRKTETGEGKTENEKKE